MTRAYRPVAPEALVDELADLIATRPIAGRALRVALDGPSCTDPSTLAGAVGVALQARGRPVAAIRGETFWRDASLRLEHGHEDVHAYPTWLDGGALRREVLDPLGPGGAGLYLPSLRDPLTNRATREPYQHAPGGAVVIVAGELLLGRELPFDLTIHLAVTPAARARRTDRAVAWTLPALDAYDADSDPANRADIAIRYDDPEHPAIST